MVEGYEVRAGCEGLTFYAGNAKQGWGSVAALLADFGITESNAGEWFVGWSDTITWELNDVIRTFQSTIGTNIDRQWYVEECELHTLKDSRTVITSDELLRVST